MNMKKLDEGWYNYFKFVFKTILSSPVWYNLTYFKLLSFPAILLSGLYNIFIK